MQRVQKFAFGTIVVGLIVLTMKASAWWLTSSAALYSDALESVVNVVASLVAFTAIRFAALPADANHPYGHAKAEFFSAVIEGVLIIVAAISILQHAYVTWSHPARFEQPWLALSLTVVSTTINGGWAAVLSRIGRSARLRGAGGRQQAFVVGRRHLRRHPRRVGARAGDRPGIGSIRCLLAPRPFMSFGPASPSSAARSAA